MDRIKEAAKIHYENSSREERDCMFAKFDSMDEDRNGRISKGEFLKLMDKVMPTSEIMCLFAEMDEDRSGSLEFHEFKTYFYIINYRPICDCCSGLVEDLYYCCIRCWKKHKSNGHKLFQVCAGCYSRNLFKHEHDHAEFKDNHVLFQANETSGQGSIRNRFKSILKGEQGSKRQRSRKAVKSAAKFLMQAVVPAAVPAAVAAVIV